MRDGWSWPQLRRELAYLFLRLHSSVASTKSVVRRRSRAAALLFGTALAVAAFGLSLVLTHVDHHVRQAIPPVVPTSDLHRPPVSEPAAPNEAAPSGRVVTVRAGETLGAIALRTGVPFEQIAEDNHLTDPRHIRPSQRLLITAAPPGVLVIAPRTTLSSYARLLGTTVHQLRLLNPQITDPDRIVAGGGLRTH